MAADWLDVNDLIRLGLYKDHNHAYYDRRAGVGPKFNRSGRFIYYKESDVLDYMETLRAVKETETTVKSKSCGCAQDISKMEHGFNLFSELTNDRINSLRSDYIDLRDDCIDDVKKFNITIAAQTKEIQSLKTLIKDRDAAKNMLKELEQVFIKAEALSKKINSEIL